MLYETDFNLWLLKTTEQLRSHSFLELDLENLIEEIEGLNRSDRRALMSYLTRLIEHVLKLTSWESEREYNANKWKAEISNFRVQIENILTDSPSLKPYLATIFEKSYENARRTVSLLIGCDISDISELPTASLDTMLDKDWFPNSQIQI